MSGGGSGGDFDERVLGEATGVGAPPPAPSGELRRAVDGMKPVRTRSRFGAAAVVALVGLVGPVIALVRGPLRRDLPGLPVGWLIAAAALWGAAFALSLAAALVPRRGDVLPAPGRASRVATVATAGLALFALAATIDVPGLSMSPGDRGWTLFDSCLHCIGTVGQVAIVVLIVGLLALRRLVPVGGSRIGMALGAGGGALGGLLLVFICPFATTTHVVLGHVGGVLLAALVGAILMRLTASAVIVVALLALMLVTGCAGPTAAGPTSGTKTPGLPAGGAGILLHGPLDGADGEALASAVKQIDAGQLDKAIAGLEALRRKHPRNSTLLHELTLAYRLARQPRRAVELLLPYRTQLPPAMLSGLGSALDEAGDNAEAEAVLREGLKRHPKSGVLYSDLGTTLRTAGKKQEALGVYLEGMSVEPTFPGNYRRAAELYALSDHRALALVYGEMFRLLDPERSGRTAELMVAVCREAVTTEGSGKAAAATVSLAPRVSSVAVGPDGKPATPLIELPLAIQLSLGPALIEAHKQGLSLASLHQARRTLVAAMAKPGGPFKDHKLPLLAWLVALDAAGHLEAYDHWLYGPGFPDEMKRWGESHRKEVQAMTAWAEDHPLFWK
jgi:tetratricopeptide (TPR) repeat protein